MDELLVIVEARPDLPADAHRGEARALSHSLKSMVESPPRFASWLAARYNARAGSGTVTDRR